MKRITPDVGVARQILYRHKQSYLRRFIRNWGTQVVDGHEVLRGKNYYYPTSLQSATFEKLCKLLGIWEDFRNPNGEGLDNAWLELDPSKAVEGGRTVEADTEVLVDNFNKMLWDATENAPEDYVSEFQITLGPNYRTFTNSFSSLSKLQRAVSSSSLMPSFANDVHNQPALIQEIKDRYQELWDSYVILGSGFVYSTGTYSTRKVFSRQIGYDDTFASLFARYILFSEDLDYEVKSVSTTTASFPFTYSDNSYYDDNYSSMSPSIISTTYDLPAYIVTIKLKTSKVAVSTDIIDRIMQDAQTPTKATRILNNNLATRKAIYGLPYEVITGEDYEGYGTTTVVPDYGLLFERVFDDRWVEKVEGSYSRYYLKVSYLNDRTYSIEDRISYLNSVISSDYKKKSVPWWKKLGAALLIVGAAILCQSCAAAVAAATTAWAMVYAVALYITYVGLVVSLLAAASSVLGMADMAQAFAQLAKAMEPLVQVASVIAIIGGIQKIAAEGAKTMAKEAVTKEAVGEVSKEVMEKIVEDVASSIIENNFMDALIAGLGAQFTNLLTAATTNISFEFASKVVMYALDLYTKIQTKNVADEIKDLQNEYTELAEEMQKQNNPVLDFIRDYSKPLAQQNSHYAALYDMCYEPYSTRYHTGNMCRTNFKALRLADNAKI
jgi:hypothetical protein